MNDLSGSLLSSIAIVGAVMLCGGALFVMLTRKITGPLKLSVEQVEGMLSQSRSLNLDFIPAPINSVLPELANGLSNLGFQNWSTYFINQSKMLTASVGVHPNGSLAVVYQHQFMGTWFEVYAQTQNRTYIWSSTPLFDESAIRGDVAINHHRLLTIHLPMKEMSRLDLVPIASENAIEYLKEQHLKNEIHRLSIPIQTANIAPLIAQTGETNPNIIQKIQYNAQAARDSHLEAVAWDAVGGSAGQGETFVVHPYSMLSEDVFMLIKQLQDEGLWTEEWDEKAPRVPAHFIAGITSVLSKSKYYHIVKSVEHPLPVRVISRV